MKKYSILFVCALLYIGLSAKKCNQPPPPPAATSKDVTVDLQLPKTISNSYGSTCALPQSGKKFRIFLEILDANGDPWNTPLGQASQVFERTSSNMFDDFTVESPTSGNFVWNFSVIDLECDNCCSPECKSGVKQGIPQFKIDKVNINGDTPDLIRPLLKFTICSCSCK